MCFITGTHVFLYRYPCVSLPVLMYIRTADYKSHIDTVRFEPTVLTWGITDYCKNRP